MNYKNVKKKKRRYNYNNKEKLRRRPHLVNTMGPWSQVRKCTWHHWSNLRTLHHSNKAWMHIRLYLSVEKETKNIFHSRVTERQIEYWHLHQNIRNYEQRCHAQITVHRYHRDDTSPGCYLKKVPAKENKKLISFLTFQTEPQITIYGRNEGTAAAN